MRIVRLANFVAPRSGGLRTALRELGAGYLAVGHEPVLIVPGDCDHDAQTPQGRVITLRGPLVPLLGGYRLLLSRRRDSGRGQRRQRTARGDRVGGSPVSPARTSRRAYARCCPGHRKGVARPHGRGRRNFGWEASVGGFLAAHGVSEAVPA